MKRTPLALAWSGLADGLSMGFSLFAEGLPFAGYLLGYMLPTLAGNVVGGVILVAALNHAQVVAGGK